VNDKNHSDLENILECPHNNVKQEGGYLVCQDCGLILDENVEFENNTKQFDYFDQSQKDYERRIRIRDSRAKQDPKIKQKYEKIKEIDKWFKDYETSFIEQKKTIDLLKGYGIGLNIDQVKQQRIKDRYIRYVKKFKKSYQNMVIIFLAILWMEIKDTTNVRLEEYIDVCNELGHKINKKMLNNAMLKILKSENRWKRTSISKAELEEQIKRKIKILFQKNINDIPFGEIKEYFEDKQEFNKLKINMLLRLDKLLKLIPYSQIKNLNYKAFTAGLLYYIGQSLEKKYRSVFIQKKVEEVTNFSSTTIRKKHHLLLSLLGEPDKIVEKIN
jgi:transcription initiation factor TFIIIB Brf1 subunit/transcription initiation factor TFIIB